MSIPQTSASSCVQCSLLREEHRPEDAHYGPRASCTLILLQLSAELLAAQPRGGWVSCSNQVRRRSDAAIAGCPARCGGGCGKVWGHQGLYKEKGERRPKGKM